MAKVSIIIPVYNTALYLRECLDSVVNQTLKDIEIILVDDGSSDGSADICREYEAIDPRIRLIVQENSGAAAARRTGVEVATSPYVGFADSDDTFDLDLYENLLEAIGDCDLVTSSAISKNGIWKDGIPAGVYSTDEEMRYVINNCIMLGDSYTRGIAGSIFCKLYKTDIARKVFEEIEPKIYFGEDAEFIYRYILLCKLICVTELCKYHYRIRESSVSHSSHNDFLENLNVLYLSMRKAFIGHPCEKRLMEQLQAYIAHYLCIVPRRMGFSEKTRFIKYVNPMYNDLADKKIALYGAGVVGKDYYLHMTREGMAPAIWVDKRYEELRLNYPISPLEALQTAEYDCIVIAVLEKELAEKITDELVELGIERKLVLWKQPIRIK